MILSGCVWKRVSATVLAVRSEGFLLLRESSGSSSYIRLKRSLRGPGCDPE